MREIKKMYLEVLQFGNGKAIEVRDIFTKATLYLHFVGILGLSVSNFVEGELNAFTNECLEVMRRNTQYITKIVVFLLILTFYLVGTSGLCSALISRYLEMSQNSLIVFLVLLLD